MKICVNSQTPFVRFKLGYSDLLEKYGSLSDPLDLSELEEKVDYEFSPGGVTSMVYPSMKRMLDDGFLTGVRWIALGVNYPPRVTAEGIQISHIEIEEKLMKNYTSFKEELWAEIHGIRPGKFTQEGYSAYASYNWQNAELMYKYMDETDIFYVQDFQLLMTGPIIGPPAPALLRWHIPFIPEKMGNFARRIVLRNMETFDGIIVSTRRDLEGLIKSQFRGKAYQLYPYVDPRHWTNHSDSKEMQELSDRINLKKDEKLVLLVARMDKIKSQDVAIKAFSLASRNRKLKLLLIGNGSFSSSGKGGLGHGKGALWRSELERLAKDLKIHERVIFLGHASPGELRAAYKLASVVMLTSELEGFGITVLEGWVNRKPVVVSTGAGSSELVINDSNGYTFPSGDYTAAAEALLKALGPNSEKLGDNGYETSRQCHIKLSLQREKSILTEVSSTFKLRKA